MSSNSIQTELDLLKTQVEKLDFDFKTARLAIDEHCSDTKSKIDLHAKKMIKKINDERLRLIQEVDTYQEQLFQDLDKRIDKTRVESTLHEAQYVINSHSSQLDLIQQEQSLRERVFDNQLIDFEPIEDPWQRVGHVRKNVLITQIKQEHQTNDYRLVKFRELPSFIAAPSAKIFPLKSGNYLLVQSRFTSDCLTIVSRDFSAIKSKKHILNLTMPENMQVSSMPDGRIVVL
jgi:hypothetical protein